MLKRSLLLIVLLTSVASAGSSEIALGESHSAPNTTEGTATLATDPDTAYAVATDFAHWSRIFPELRRAVVNRRSGDRSDVTLVHRDGTIDHFRFRNRPAARLVAFEQVGGDADVSGEIVFDAGDRTGTTHVRSRLHADVHGLASAFVSDSRLREQRQAHLREELLHLQAYFLR